MFETSAKDPNNGQEMRLGEPSQQLVRIDKASDTFSLAIPGKPTIEGIPAEFLPELRDQLNLNGAWLSCYSYLFGHEDSSA